MKNNKTFSNFLIVVIIASLAFVAFNYFSDRDETGNSGPAAIVLIPAEYDAGTVSMQDGLVEKTFEIKNDGQGDLKIENIWTSCMCTTAHLRVGNKTSPEFGMHTQFSLWSEIISPGETGYLDVVFDPAFHGPKGTGSLIRVIYLATNDTNNKQAQIKMLINVIK